MLEKDPSLFKIEYKAIIFIVVIAYLMLGIFPFIPIENDGMRIALGIQSSQLYNNQRYLYRYASQAGTYHFTTVTMYALGLDSFNALSFMSALSSIVFILASVFFLSRITHASFLISFFSLILFQETYVSGYYPNSSIIAAAAISVALLLTTFRNHLFLISLSGIFFTIACWMRFDAVLIGLAFVILFSKPVKRSLISISIFAVSSLLTGIIIFYFSDINIQMILKQYLSHSVSIDIKKTLNVYSTIFTLATLYFIAFGLYLLVKQKQWLLVSLAILGPFPLIIGYGLSLLTPKYLLYSMIFFSIPIAYGIMNLISQKSRGKTMVLLVGILLVTGQYVFTPAYNLIFHRSIMVHTADHSRLRGVIAYTPLYWTKQKIGVADQFTSFKEKLDDYLNHNNPVFIISHDWMANQWLLYYLHSIGYRITKEEKYSDILEHGQLLTLEMGKDKLFLLRWNPESYKFIEILDENESQNSKFLYIGSYDDSFNQNQFNSIKDEFNLRFLDNWKRFRVYELSNQ